MNGIPIPLIMESEAKLYEGTATNEQEEYLTAKEMERLCICFVLPC